MVEEDTEFVKAEENKLEEIEKAENIEAYAQDLEKSRNCDTSPGALMQSDVKTQSSNQCY